MSHLIFIHIGPVQEFIAAARKTRDLWFGSWMLSELAKAAALAIAEAEGTDALIFPAVKTKEALFAGSTLDAPNKILAKIEGNPEGLSAQIKGAYRVRLEALRDEAFGRIRGSFEVGWAKQQVDDLSEFYWSSVPLLSDGEYKSKRRLGERLLAARKNTRDYKQPSWAAKAPKSTLGGHLEAVIDEDNYPRPNDSDEEKQRKGELLYKNYRVSGAERLSGVDLLKRYGQRGAKGDGAEFPSTSHMAALPAALWSVKNHKDAWERFVWSLGTDVIDRSQLRKPYEYGTSGHTRIDASVLFEGRLRELAEELGRTSETFIPTLKAFQESVKDKSKIPLPYYAILIGDGDGMGKALSNLGDAQQHRAFSQALSDFATGVEKKVHGHHGVVVYAGGDDVLALLPLHRALEAAQDVAAFFRETMCEYNVTFSAGIAITHFMEPLSDSLNLARDAEQKAKEVPNKNALAVTVSKRSGTDRTVVGKWDDLDRTLLKLANLHRLEAIPDGVAYQIQEVVMKLGGLAALKSDPTLTRIVAKEAERIIDRKRAQAGSEEVSRDDKKFLYAQFNEADSRSVMRFIRMSVISKLFADAKGQAGEPLSAEEEKSDG